MAMHVKGSVIGVIGLVPEKEAFLLRAQLMTDLSTCMSASQALTRPQHHSLPPSRLILDFM